MLGSHSQIHAPFEPDMVSYGEQGEQKAAARGLGDPTTLAKHTRPTTGSLGKWAKNLTGQPAKGPGFSRHTLERRLLVAIRRRVGDNALGRLIRKVREVCDVLLRWADDSARVTGQPASRPDRPVAASIRPDHPLSLAIVLKPVRGAARFNERGRR